MSPKVVSPNGILHVMSDGLKFDWMERHKIKDYLGSLEGNVWAFSSRSTLVSLLIALLGEIVICCMSCMLMYVLLK